MPCWPVTPRGMLRPARKPRPRAPHYAAEPVSLAATRGRQDSAGAVSFLSGGPGARGAEGGRRPISFRWRAHVSAHRADRLQHGAAVRIGMAAADGGLRGGGRVPDAFLPAQAAGVRHGGRHLGNVRPDDLPGGRAGIPRAVLDRHNAERGQHAAARAEGGARKAHPADRAGRGADLQQVPAADRGGDAGAAQQDFGPFQINPFKTWLVVVAVSTISYGSYVIQRLTKEQGGVLLAALLGGAYSSTVTTVVLSRRAGRENRPHLFAGGTLMASGVMYVRLAALVGMFNVSLLARLGLPLAALAVAATAAGWFWSRLPDPSEQKIAREYVSRNPLELGAAVLFALFFLAMVVATHLTVQYLGNGGVYTLALIMGVTDVDPFIMGMTQTAGTATPLTVAAASIVIAAASNNLVK